MWKKILSDFLHQADIKSLNSDKSEQSHSCLMIRNTRAQGRCLNPFGHDTPQDYQACRVKGLVPRQQNCGQVYNSSLIRHNRVLSLVCLTALAITRSRGTPNEVPRGKTKLIGSKRQGMILTTTLSEFGILLNLINPYLPVVRTLQSTASLFWPRYVQLINSIQRRRLPHSTHYIYIKKIKILNVW